MTTTATQIWTPGLNASTVRCRVTAIIDHNDTVVTIGGVEAGVHNMYSHTLELWQSPTSKHTVDLSQHKVIIKDGNTIQGVYR